MEQSEDNVPYVFHVSPETIEGNTQLIEADLTDYVPLTEKELTSLRSSLRTALDEPPVYLGDFSQYADDE